MTDTYARERSALLRLLTTRGAINAAFVVYLLVDPPATYPGLLRMLGVFALLDGLAAALLAWVLRRAWQPEPYWISSLVTGVSRLALAATVALVPDLARHPLLLMVFIAAGSTVAGINGLMNLVVAAYLRRDGVRSSLSGWFMVLGLAMVAAGVFVAVRLQPSLHTARPILVLISAIEAVALAAAALQVARTPTLHHGPHV
jgi:uncharacterized membrane protein HdeD (DUF308 family)